MGRLTRTIHQGATIELRDEEREESLIVRCESISSALIMLDVAGEYRLPIYCGREGSVYMPRSRALVTIFYDTEEDPEHDDPRRRARIAIDAPRSILILRLPDRKVA
jgi:hypothetical protein